MQIIPAEWKMLCYKVSGKNKKTKRKKSVLISTLSLEESLIAERSNLFDIYDISLSFDSPSKEQIKYAEDLGFSYNDSLSKQDYSAIISKLLGDEPNDVLPLDVALFAERVNVFISSFSSFPRAYNEIYHSFELKEKIEFFSFSVFQKLNGFLCYDLINHPNYLVFQKYAESCISNNKLIKSLDCYCGADFVPNKSIKNSFALQDCKRFLTKSFEKD